MGEFDFTDNLITLARFRNSAEAAIARARLEAEGIETSLDGDSTSTVLSHVGADLVGPSLLVRQGDLRRARDLMDALLGADEEPDDEDVDDYDADDWSGEDWADHEDDPYEEYSEAPAQTPPLTRAWRAALIGGLLLPCLLINLYSVWLIAEHQLWLPQPGEKSVNWRFPAALFFNLFGFFFFWLIVSW